MLKSNNFPEEVAKFLHSGWGISHLFPPQKEALKPLIRPNALICINSKRKKPAGLFIYNQTDYCDEARNTSGIHSALKALAKKNMKI